VTEGVHVHDGDTTHRAGVLLGLLGVGRRRARGTVAPPDDGVVVPLDRWRRRDEVDLASAPRPVLRLVPPPGEAAR